MTKVGELLDLAGLDDEVIKSVTEKLADEDVVLEGEKEMQDEKLEKTAQSPEHEEPGKEAEDEKKAPVDPETNEGGYNAVTEEELQQFLADFRALKEEYAKLVAERAIEESAEEESSEEGIEEALGTLLSLVKEAYEQTAIMKADFETLKEEYAKLVAERIIKEGCDQCDEVEVDAKDEEKATKDDEEKATKDDEEDKAERAKDEEKVKEVEAQEDEEKADKDKEEGKKEEADKEEKKAEEHKKEEAKDKDEEDKDYEEAHESLAETIAKGVTEISEEAPAKAKIAKAYSAFSNISEAVEVKEEKKARKAFTVFPNL